MNKLITRLVISLALLAPLASLAAKSELKSSHFFLNNKTDKTVVVHVGNFFPTKYTLKPHSSKFVFVSTRNQTVEISEVH